MKRKAYETPNVTRSVILMEDGVMAASGESMDKAGVKLVTSEQEDGSSYDSFGTSWE